MVNEELEQQNKQEQKEERKEETKKTLKTVITSVICTLLFVIILLLLVILCLKNCSSRNNNNNTSSSSEPEPTESYPTADLNDVFKKIMDAAFVDYTVDDTTTEIYAVTCTDNKDVNSTFQLDISAKGSGSTFYYLSVPDARYENSTDNKTLIPYLLGLKDLDRATEAEKYFLDGTIEFATGLVTTETRETSQTNNKYVITKPTETSDIRYLSGYYKDDNGYRAYSKKQLEGTQDPFLTGGVSIAKGNILYDYYYFCLDK